MKPVTLRDDMKKKQNVKLTLDDTFFTQPFFYHRWEKLLQEVYFLQSIFINYIIDRRFSIKKIVISSGWKHYKLCGEEFLHYDVVKDINDDKPG